MNLLQKVLLYPIISIIIVLITSIFNKQYLFKVANINALISFILSCYLFTLMDWTTSNFQFQFTLPLISSLNFEVSFGIDSISIWFILLTNIFIFLCIISLSPEDYSNYLEFVLYLFFLQWGVLGAFSILDLLGFYIFFEATLISIFIIILVWGSRERKARASYLIAIYTLLGSIFMFFNILYILEKTGTTNYQFLLTILFSESDQKFLWITFFIAFAAKIPLFPLHIWLPEAHVEAPTVGSVLLAVLLLKLGTYGIIRFLIPLFPYGTHYYSGIVHTFAAIGALYTGFVAIRQIDLKKQIAYSSVVHMNVVLLGIVSSRVEALEGAIFQMLSHGIVSGALFFCVGVIYSRYHTRDIIDYGGLVEKNPLLSIVYFIFSMANISFPTTSSFVGEFLIFAGIFGENSFIAILTFISSILGAIYTLWAYNRVFFAKLKSTLLNNFNMDLVLKEFLIFAVLILMLMFVGCYPSYVTDTLHTTCENILSTSNFFKK